MPQGESVMFNIKIVRYSNDAAAEICLDLDVQHENPKLFHVTFTAIIRLVLEEGFDVKDADQEEFNNFKVIANSLFSENDIQQLQENRYFKATSSENSKLMELLFDALRDFLND